MCAGLCAIGIVVAACPAESAQQAQPAQPAYITCSNGTPAPGTAVGQDIEKCAACNPGYHLEGDRCAINTFMCTNGTAKADGTAGATHSAQLCAACNDDYHLEGDLCVIDAYVCANGTAASGAPDEHNTEMCAACNDGYHSEGDRCAINAYACANGRPVSGVPAVHDTQKCAVCNDGYHKGENNNDLCDANVYMCANGVAAAEGTSGGTHGGQLCASCTPATKTMPGYGLAGNVCELLGAEVRVGDAQKFGDVLETAPAGLAAVDGMLYMVGGRGRLYTLNTSDGTAKPVVPSVTNFGVNESDPRGLVFFEKTLYMAGDSTNALYTIDRDTGMASRVNMDVDKFGESIDSPRGLAATGGKLYMVTADTGAEFVYVLAISGSNAGGATKVSRIAAGGFGVMESNPGGLAAIGNTLYMVGKRLYTLNIGTGDSAGTASPVGTTAEFNFSVSAGTPLGLGLAAADNTPTDMTDDDYTLYMVGNSAALYTLAY